MDKKVNVDVLTGGAIYVDDTRITGRGTKWGAKHQLASFICDPASVYAECVARGFKEHAAMIDTPGYGAPHLKEAS